MSLLLRHLKQQLEELETDRTELQGRVEELYQENQQLLQQHLAESAAKTRLSQEASRLTADNMVCVCVFGMLVCDCMCVCVCGGGFVKWTYCSGVGIVLRFSFP